MNEPLCPVRSNPETKARLVLDGPWIAPSGDTACLLFTKKVELTKGRPVSAECNQIVICLSCVLCLKNEETPCVIIWSHGRNSSWRGGSA